MLGAFVSSDSFESFAGHLDDLDFAAAVRLRSICMKRPDRPIARVPPVALDTCGRSFLFSLEEAKGIEWITQPMSEKFRTPKPKKERQNDAVLLLANQQYMALGQNRGDPGEPPIERNTDLSTRDAGYCGLDSLDPLPYVSSPSEIDF